MTKRGKKKRVYRRKKLYKIPKQMGAFSNYQLVNLRYGTQFVLDSTVIGTYGNYYFRANSCFDPDESSAGHQPRGFDQWSAFYDNYVVLGSKITVYANNTLQQLEAGDTSHSKFNMVFPVLSLTEDKNLIVGDVPQLLESRLHSYKALNTNEYNTAKLTKKFSARKFLGFQRPQDETALIAPVTGNPTQEVWFQVTAFDGSTTTATSASLHCTAVIDYVVMFKNRKILPQS